MKIGLKSYEVIERIKECVNFFDRPHPV